MQIFFSNSLDFEPIIHRYKFVNIKTLKKALVLHDLEFLLFYYKSVADYQETISIPTDSFALYCHLVACNIQKILYQPNLKFLRKNLLNL